MKKTIRLVPILIACFFAPSLFAQPAWVEEMKREKEAMKKEQEYYREMRKADDEYYREMAKAEAEYYREMRKADEEYHREMLKADKEAYKNIKIKARKEAMKEGRYLPPPPSYYEEEYYEEYEYDDEHYENDDYEYEDDRYERPRRRPTNRDGNGEVIIEGEVKVRGKKRIPLPYRPRNN